MDKNKLWNEYNKELNGEYMDIHLLFNFFDSTVLEGLLKFIKEENEG